MHEGGGGHIGENFVPRLVDAVFPCTMTSQSLCKTQAIIHIWCEQGSFACELVHLRRIDAGLHLRKGLSYMRTEQKKTRNVMMLSCQSWECQPGAQASVPNRAKPRKAASKSARGSKKRAKKRAVLESNEQSRGRRWSHLLGFSIRAASDKRSSRWVESDHAAHAKAVRGDARRRMQRAHIV